MNGREKVSFHKEAKTNEQGGFTVELPFPVGKHVRRIKKCSVRLLSSSEPHCSVASKATSSSLHLTSRKQGTRIFSAGFFTFQPSKQPYLCNDKPSPAASTSWEKTYLPHPAIPSFPPLRQKPPSLQLPPLFPPFPYIPSIPRLPPISNLGTLPSKSSKTLDEKTEQQTLIHPPFLARPTIPRVPLPPTNNPLQPPSLPLQPAPPSINLPPSPTIPPTPRFPFPFTPFPFPPGFSGFPGVPTFPPGSSGFPGSPPSISFPGSPGFVGASPAPSKKFSP